MNLFSGTQSEPIWNKRSALVTIRIPEKDRFCELTLEHDGEFVCACGRQRKEKGERDVYVGAQKGTSRARTADGKPGDEREAQVWWVPGKSKSPDSLYLF
jgi:hypothetical protein